LVQATAKDDRGLKDIALEHRHVGQASSLPPRFEETPALSRSSRPEETQAGSLRHETHDETHAEADPPWEHRLPLDMLTDRLRSNDDKPLKEAAVRHELSLGELLLPPGDQLLLRVVASDHCNVGEPRVGRSVTRTLTVVTPE